MPLGISLKPKNKIDNLGVREVRLLEMGTAAATFINDMIMELKLVHGPSSFQLSYVTAPRGIFPCHLTLSILNLQSHQ